jgi:branched-chain amino acid transport system substrate-binding protein
MPITSGIRRRTLLKASFAAGVLQVASPFVFRARAADVVKIGLDNPLTGAIGGLGKNELIGCQLAVEQINAKGGILSREVELIVEDSTSSDAGTAVLKARKFIDGDKVDFLLGNTNSALSLATAQVSNEKKILLSFPAAIPTPSREPAVTGMFSESATPRRWKRRRSPQR